MKVYVFIDASNLWAAQKVKGRFFDYEKLKTFVRNKFIASLVKIFIILLIQRTELVTTV